MIAIKDSLQTERSSGTADQNLDREAGVEAVATELLSAMLDDDDGTTDEVSRRDDGGQDGPPPEAALRRRLWKKSDFEAWKKEVESLASLTFDIEYSLRRAQSITANLGSEIDPIAERTDETERSLKRSTGHLVEIHERLGSLSG